MGRRLGLRADWSAALMVGGSRTDLDFGVISNS